MGTESTGASRKRLVLGGLILVVLILGGLGLKAWRQAEVRASAKRNMEQFERVWKQYANTEKAAVISAPESTRESGGATE